MLIPVILSGGAGTRLWPLSRELYPKQLLRLVADRTMLQETVARTDGLPGLAAESTFSCSYPASVGGAAGTQDARQVNVTGRSRDATIGAVATTTVAIVAEVLLANGFE